MKSGGQTLWNAIVFCETDKPLGGWKGAIRKTIWRTIQRASGSFGVTVEEHPSSVKSIPLTTENWLRKLYDKNYNNDTSNEDKHKTNYSMNNDTRNMHIT